MRHRDDLGIGRRQRRTEALYSKRWNSAESARLGLFITIAGKDTAGLNRQRIVVQSVLKQASDRPGRTLGSQGYGTPTLVIEGVHFLCTTSVVSPTERKKLGMLKNRHAFRKIRKVPRFQAGFFSTYCHL